MTRNELAALDGRLDAFLADLAASLGRSERRRWVRAYLEGLLLDGARKSIEPLAWRLYLPESWLKTGGRAAGKFLKKSFIAARINWKMPYAVAVEPSTKVWTSGPAAVPAPQGNPEDGLKNIPP